MSGRHRRPQRDALPDVDVAADLTAGPPVPAATAEPVPGVASRAPGPTVVARRDRAAERAARRRRDRVRLLAVAAAAVAVLLVVALVWQLQRGGDTPGTGVSAGPARQQTTLVQVTGADGTAVASALVGTSKAGGASAVLVPSGLLVDVAGSGEMPFGEAVTLDPAAPSRASAAALTDLLGVSVQDGWVLSTAGLAKLVDAVGGVEVTVGVDVTATDAKGNQSVVVRAGRQTLKGAGAAAYATYLADGEPEQARLARFDEVLRAVAAALPADPAGVAAVLGAIGDGSRPTLPAAALAQRLVVLRDAVAARSLVADTLPVQEIDTGGSVPAYGVDLGAAAAMMRSMFPGALQQDAGGEAVRVLVENGLGTPGLVEQARTKLVDAGFRFVNGGNAASFTQDPSLVEVPDGTDRSLARGRRVAAVLGLPDSAVTTEDRGQNVADVIVILGKDFVP